MYQYNATNRILNDLNIIFVISLKLKEEVFIGRANNSNIRLSDVSVSRNHAKLEYFNGDFYLEDIGSKFGTLLLIQNNILFLPYKDINIQTGRSLLMFKLKRTCLGLFKCYKNKLYNNKSYLESFLNNEKKVYTQILETFNKNIIDPIEKFSSISGSCTPSEKSSVTIEEKKLNDTKSIDNKELNEEEKSEEKNSENTNMKLNISNGQGNNEILIESYKEENQENNNNNEYTESIPIFNLNIDKLNKDILVKEENKKQNESHDLFINEINNDENKINTDKNNKNIFSKLNVMKLLNKKDNINQRSISAFNNKQKINLNLKLSQININNNFKNNDLALTQRDNKDKNIIAISKEYFTFTKEQMDQIMELLVVWKSALE